MPKKIVNTSIEFTVEEVHEILQEYVQTKYDTTNEVKICYIIKESSGGDYEPYLPMRVVEIVAKY